MAADGEPKERYIVQTERLILRLADPRIDKDCEHILETYLDADSSNGGHGKVGLSNIEDVRYKHAVNGPRAEFCTLAPPPRGIYLLVFLRDTASGEDVEGDYIGISGMSFRPEMPFPDLGWAILGPYQGQGYATEAAKAGLKFWREVIGVKEVCALMTDVNEKSARLAERIGFVKGGALDIFFGTPPEEQKFVGKGFMLPAMKWTEGLWIQPQMERPDGWRWKG